MTNSLMSLKEDKNYDDLVAIAYGTDRPPFKEAGIKVVKMSTLEKSTTRL